MPRHFLCVVRSFISRATCQAGLGRIHKTNNKKVAFINTRQYLCDEKKDSVLTSGSPACLEFFFLHKSSTHSACSSFNSRLNVKHFLIQSVTSAVLTQIRQSHKYLLHFLPTRGSFSLWYFYINIIFLSRVIAPFDISGYWQTDIFVDGCFRPKFIP